MHKVPIAQLHGDVASHVAIRRSGIPRAGLGAFWAGPQPLRPSARTIGRYEGVVTPTMPAGSDYVFCASRRRYIDAADPACSNWTRYMNDPHGTRRRPNVAFTPWGRIRVLRRIRPGDEFLIRYGRDYWAT
jgi:hypothetical protein